MFRSRLRILLAQKEDDERRVITQGEIAEHTGLSRATINSWMSHRGKPRVDAVSARAICDYFECDLSELVELEPKRVKVRA